jgi:predicted Ser/Thr protein kinase
VDPLRRRDPERIGIYRIVGRLGEGGQGVVYLAETEAGDRVAVKMVHGRLADGPSFARELAAARQVAEFCTVRILDADLEADPPYIVSEYVDGPSLQQVVESQGPRHGAVLHRLAIGTATALAAIHRAGVIHRDFKPSNVLIGPDGPRVIDFGIARLIDTTGTTGAVTGTPPYMAPEHFLGDRVGSEADVFAWGSTMTYAATGKPPFGSESLAAVAFRILHDEPDLSGLSGDFLELVRHCLAKEPEARPRARDVLLQLLDHSGRDVPHEMAALQEGTALAVRDQEGTALAVRDKETGPGRPAVSDPQVVPGMETGREKPGGTDRITRRRLLAGAGAGITALAVSGATIWRSWPADGRADALPKTPAPLPASSPPVPTAVVTSGRTGAPALSPTPTAASTPSPSASATESEAPLPAPSTPVELVSAIDASLAISPEAMFSYAGTYTQSDVHLEASGRVVHHGADLDRTRTDFDMRITGVQIASDSRVVVVGEKYYVVGRKTYLYKEVEDRGELPDHLLSGWYATHIAATGSVKTILELIAGSRQVRRVKGVYSATVKMEAAGYDLRHAFLDFLGGDDKALNTSFVSYALTIDAEDRPTRFVLRWKFPVAEVGFYESVFTTTYRGWRSGGEIRVPR